MKRRVHVVPSPPACEKPASTTYEYEFESTGTAELKSCEPEAARPQVVGTMKAMARLIWETDYETLFQLEQLALEQSHGLMTGAMLLKSLAGISTYRERKLDLKRRGEQAVAKDQSDAAMDLAVRAFRQANQQRHSFSVLVRSLHALSKRTPSAMWRRQRNLKALVARETATTFAKLVMQARQQATAWTHSK